MSNFIDLSAGSVHYTRSLYTRTIASDGHRRARKFAADSCVRTFRYHTDHLRVVVESRSVLLDVFVIGYQVRHQAQIWFGRGQKAAPHVHICPCY